MDRPPFRQCLTLYGVASRSWRDLTVGWASQGIDPWRWSARLLLDVVASMMRNNVDDPLRAARVDAATSPDGFDDWGKVTADEAATIMARDNRDGRRL